MQAFHFNKLSDALTTHIQQCREPKYFSRPSGWRCRCVVAMNHLGKGFTIRKSTSVAKSQCMLLVRTVNGFIARRIHLREILPLGQKIGSGLNPHSSAQVPDLEPVINGLPNGRALHAFHLMDAELVNIICDPNLADSDKEKRLKQQLSDILSTIATGMKTLNHHQAQTYTTICDYLANLSEYLQTFQLQAFGGERPESSRKALSYMLGLTGRTRVSYQDKVAQSYATLSVTASQKPTAPAQAAEEQGDADKKQDHSKAQITPYNSKVNEPVIPPIVLEIGEDSATADRQRRTSRRRRTQPTPAFQAPQQASTTSRTAAASHYAAHKKPETFTYQATVTEQERREGQTKHQGEERATAKPATHNSALPSTPKGEEQIAVFSPYLKPCVVEAYYSNRTFRELFNAMAKRELPPFMSSVDQITAAAVYTGAIAGYPDTYLEPEDILQLLDNKKLDGHPVTDLFRKNGQLDTNKVTMQSSVLHERLAQLAFDLEELDNEVARLTLGTGGFDAQ